MIMYGWKPYKDSGEFIEWRKREHNKIADCIANFTLKSKHSFSHRNEELLAAIRRGNANILTFSDGGYWAEDNLAVGAWVSYVLSGHWGDSGVHLLAAEGIFIDTPANAFLAEMIAAESALSFMHSLV